MKKPNWKIRRCANREI